MTEEQREWMDAGYGQGVMNTEARAAKRIKELESEVKSLAGQLKTSKYAKKLVKDKFDELVQEVGNLRIENRDLKRNHTL